MNKNEINKKLEELSSRNQSIFNEFLNNVPKVDLGIYSKTFKEKNEYEESIKDRPFSYMPREVLEGLGFRAFYKYSDLIIDCINKMAENENRKEIIFNENDILNSDRWSERVKKLRDGDIWINLIESLKWCVAYTHEERVKKMREKSKPDSGEKESNYLAEYLGNQ